jgi:hypothetical protein
MLGKVGLAMVVTIIASVGACASNVMQDKASGPDGKVKGAREMKFENNEAIAKGIVTYPGGDRSDWKFMEVPDKKVGQIEIKLTWQAPRRGLQLAFDVFDEWNYPVTSSKKTSKKRSKGTLREGSIANAHGKYFVRVYAVGRGDAGAYKLTADFVEAVSGPQYDPAKLEVSDPPRLAEVPAATIACDEFSFDAKNPACKPVCPTEGAPPNWPACKDKCPNPPDVKNPKCWDTMPCPTPMDRNVKSCKFPACPDPKAPDPNNPNCDNATVDPVTTRILKNGFDGDLVEITVGAGSTSGIAKGWRGVVLRGETDATLGEITIKNVDKNIVRGTVKLTTDQIMQNRRVRFFPPPRSR